MRATRMRNVAALVIASTTFTFASGPRAATDTRPNHGDVPIHTPGRELPVVREHSYRMAGKVRVLLLWVGRDDVGSAVIKWKKSGEDRAFELLIGSDPQRAPGQLNKWGYFVEETRGGNTSVVGLISQENDEALSDVKADLKTKKEQRAFDTVRGFVAEGQGRARVGTLHAPSELTYHDVETVLAPVLADTSLPLKQLARRDGVRAGFLTSLLELMNGTLAGGQLHKKHIPYIHGDRLFEIRLVESNRVAKFERDGRTFQDVIRARFETGQAGTRDPTRFDLVYGAAGPLAGIPVLISYQPKWWLQVDLVLIK